MQKTKCRELILPVQWEHAACTTSSSTLQSAVCRSKMPRFTASETLNAIFLAVTLL